MRITWHEQAIPDLRHLRGYIDQYNPAAARSVAIRITQSVALLAGCPEMGRKGRVPGTRELVIPDTPYIAAYGLHSQIVEILAVLHAARKWPDDFERAH